MEVMCSKGSIYTMRIICSKSREGHTSESMMLPVGLSKGIAAMSNSRSYGLELPPNDQPHEPETNRENR
eukprot:1161982-Pelagomonas_calceolata.AAC.5